VHYTSTVKKKIIFVFVFQGRARVFFEAGEFLSLGTSLCLFVGGSCSRHRVSSPAIMEERNVSFFLAVSKKSAQIAERF
jgi:hypothetical protein